MKITAVQLISAILNNISREKFTNQQQLRPIKMIFLNQLQTCNNAACIHSKR